MAYKKQAKKRNILAQLQQMQTLIRCNLICTSFAKNVTVNAKY